MSLTQHPSLVRCLDAYSPPCFRCRRRHCVRARTWRRWRAPACAWPRLRRTHPLAASRSAAHSCCERTSRPQTASSTVRVPQRLHRWLRCSPGMRERAEACARAAELLTMPCPSPPVRSSGHGHPAGGAGGQALCVFARLCACKLVATADTPCGVADARTLPGKIPGLGFWDPAGFTDGQACPAGAQQLHCLRF